MTGPPGSAGLPKRPDLFSPRMLLLLGVALVLLGIVGALRICLGQGIFVGGIGAMSLMFGGLLYYRATVLDRDVVEAR